VGSGGYGVAGGGGVVGVGGGRGGRGGRGEGSEDGYGGGGGGRGDGYGVMGGGGGGGEGGGGEGGGGDGGGESESESDWGGEGGGAVAVLFNLAAENSSLKTKLASLQGQGAHADAGVRQNIILRLTPWALQPFLVGGLSAAAAIRKLPHTIINLSFATLRSQRG